MLLVCVFAHCASYRYYVLHKLPQLTFLDSKPVSNDERKEAKRVGAFMRVVRPASDDVSLSPSYSSLINLSSMSS